GIVLRVPDAADHGVEIRAHFLLRKRRVAADGFRIAIAPRFKDRGEGFSRRALRVDSDVVDRKLLEAELAQKTPRAAADALVGVGVAREGRNAFVPEVVRIKLAG